MFDDVVDIIRDAEIVGERKVTINFIVDLNLQLFDVLLLIQRKL